MEEDSLAAHLMEMYFMEVPEGIAKRRKRNEQIEHEIDEEDRTMQEAMMGYAFTFDRKQFWDLLGSVPRELKKKFISFGIVHPQSEERAPLCKSDFERIYHRDPREAYVWQEFYSDCHDDDALMELIRMIRSAVQPLPSCGVLS